MNRPEASSPLRPATRAIIRSRLRSVMRLMKDVSAGGIRKPEYIHQLRVAIRRAEAAISAFEAGLRPKAVARARKRLREVRKAAGAVRDCDVHRALLRTVEGLDAPAQHPLLKYLSRRLRAARRDAAREVVRVARPEGIRKVKRARRALLDLSQADGADAASNPPSLLAAALRTFNTSTTAARAAAAKDLSNLDNLHALRVSAKQVRYAVEIFRACLPDSLCESTLAHLRDFQAILGQVNDARLMSAWLTDEARNLAARPRSRSAPSGASVESIHEELRAAIGRLDVALATAHASALPRVAQRLDGALTPLEAWTTAAVGHTFPETDPAPERPGAIAGRRAQGPAERRENADTVRRTQASPG